MELVPTIRELMDHNYWARDQQLRACAGLDQERFERALGGSFPSLRESFAHLLAVEWLWLEREMRSYLAGLDEEALARRLTCCSTRGVLVGRDADFRS